jgi:hypothetical protein
MNIALRLLGCSLVLSTLAAVGACASSDDEGAPPPAPPNTTLATDEGTDPSLSDDADDFPAAKMISAPWAETVVDTPWGKQNIKYQMVDGDAIAEGDMIIGGGSLSIRSATSLGRHWPDGLIPYVIDGNLPQPARAVNAIAHWEAKTKIRFVERTTERDYVHFRSANSCSSNIGQWGGRQFVNLTTFESPLNLAAVGIDRSVTPERYYFYYRDGYATVGSNVRVNSIRPHLRFALPPGKSTTSLVEVAFASNGHLFSYYDDGTFAEGTYSDLTFYASAKPYALASGKTPADVTGIAIDRENRAYAYYLDGTYSVGTWANLASAAAPQPFKVANGVTPADLVHVDVASDGMFQAYYLVYGDNPDGGTHLFRGMGNSFGLPGDLGSASNNAMKGVRFPGHCSTGSTIHEIGHAVGLFHEQTRHDRDNYVKILFENVEPEDRFNFEKHSLVVGTDTGPYDFNSIMHYGPKAFSANGKDTIVAVDGRTFREQRDGLSEGDLAGVRAMYP